MGARNSKVRKGDKNGVAGSEGESVVDRTATLPASFRHKEEEAAKTETLPRSLNRSTSFTNSCRNWAKKKGLVKDSSIEECTADDIIAEIEVKTPESPKENGNGTAVEPKEVSRPPSAESTKAMSRLAQKKARAQFFEDLYNSSGISVNSAITPEKPKRLCEMNLPSPRIGPGTPEAGRPEGKVEQLAKQIEEKEKLNRSLDSEITSLDRSLEEEGDKEAVFTLPGLVAAESPHVHEIIDKNEDIPKVVSEEKSLLDEVREDLIQTTKENISNNTEIDDEEVKGLLKVEQMLRAPHEKDIIESIEDKVIEKADSEGEVKGALKVMEILEQTDEPKVETSIVENNIEISESTTISHAIKDNLIETTKEKAFDETVKSEVSFDQDETLPSTAKLLDSSTVSEILNDGEDCMCDTLLGGLAHGGEKEEVHEAKENVVIGEVVEKVNENMSVTKTSFEEVSQTSYHHEEVRQNSTTTVVETSASTILDDGEDCMCDTLLGGLAHGGEKETDTQGKVDVIGEFEEVNKNMTIEPSSLESVGTDEETKVMENGEVEGVNNVTETGNDDSSEEGGASTDEGYDDEKKVGGAKGLRKVLNTEVDTEELGAATTGSVMDE